MLAIDPPTVTSGPPSTKLCPHWLKPLVTPLAISLWLLVVFLVLHATIKVLLLHAQVWQVVFHGSAFFNFFFVWCFAKCDQYLTICHAALLRANRVPACGSQACIFQPTIGGFLFSCPFMSFLCLCVVLASLLGIWKVFSSFASQTGSQGSFQYSFWSRLTTLSFANPSFWRLLFVEWLSFWWQNVCIFSSHLHFDSKHYQIPKLPLDNRSAEVNYVTDLYALNCLLLAPVTGFQWCFGSFLLCHQRHRCSSSRLVLRFGYLLQALCIFDEPCRCEVLQFLLASPAAATIQHSILTTHGLYERYGNTLTLSAV